MPNRKDPAKARVAEARASMNKAATVPGARKTEAVLNASVQATSITLEVLDHLIDRVIQIEQALKAQPRPQRPPIAR